MASDRRSPRYVVGLTLIILSFIGCVMSYWLIPFGLPVYATGAILVFVSTRKLTVKWLTVLIPLMLWLPSTLIFLYWYGRTTPEAYLIPSDYEGIVRVVYGEPCGIEPEFEDGRRVLPIPSNGQLIIRPEFEAGMIDHQYYFIDSAGKRTPIGMIEKYKGRSFGMPGVMVGGSGSIGGPMPDGSSSTESPLAIHFSDVYVFNKDSIWVEGREAQMNNLTKSLVEGCRGAE